MKSVLNPARSSFPADSVERILNRYYAQFVEWSEILTRGDKSAAEETVQDLCLYFVLARPDLSHIDDLEAYLYTCLRNMYLSNLARVSRERLRIIYVEDYDAIGLAAAHSGHDNVNVQNELLRISNYVVSRKYTSKNASHFILHFFLGYRRSDVALLARLPIAAIYNKLSDIRRELREHLSSGAKIHVISRDALPEKQPLRTALPSEVFLKTLRSIVLDANSVDCIAEDKLVEQYRLPNAPPVGCRQLAHLAGCERCLTILDHALRLDDRDGPFDGLDKEPALKGEERQSFQATMRMVEQRRKQIMQQRPTLLAIAVNGSVVAFHQLEAAHNSLFARVEDGSSTRFIEVFSEYGDRLIHIPLDANALIPKRHQLSQELLLSDGRSLRLDIHFDGLGIQAEAVYIDPALAPDEPLEHVLPSHRKPAFLWSRFTWLERFRFAPWSAAVLAFALLVAIGGIASYRYVHPNGRNVLARSRAVAEVALPTETLHQVVRIEETSRSAKQIGLGSVDIWRSDDRRAVRLYNTQRQLIATSIMLSDGSVSERIEKNAPMSEQDRQIVESGIWRSDLSSSGFDDGQDVAVDAVRTSAGFELTRTESGSDGILSRTLILDRGYHVQAERVRVKTTGGILEVRLVQTLLQRIPNKYVPNSIFSRSQATTVPGEQSEGNPYERPGKVPSEAASGSDLEVNVLFILFQLEVDTGQPIEVSTSAEDRVILAGTLADTQLLTRLRQRIAALPNANRVDFRIRSATEAASAVHRSNVPGQVILATSGEAPGAGLVRKSLQARGLKEAALTNAERDFAEGALRHAQAALQHAYALDRLGQLLARSGQSSLDSNARTEWAQMTARHSAALATELSALRVQLDSVSAGTPEVPSANGLVIGDPLAFGSAASNLRAKVQAINEKVLDLFVSGAASLPQAQVPQLVTRLREALPVAEANRINSFADHLAARSPAEQYDVGEMHKR